MRSILLLFALNGAALAGSPDCAAPQTQADMTQCAAIAYSMADGDLNLAYGFALAMMQSTDAALAPDRRGAVDALRAAQRAWIDFRDAGCRAEGYRVDGGSMQSMVVSACLERVTRARTEELRALGETW